MSSSATNNNNQVAAIPPSVNPFSEFKSTVNLDPNDTIVSNLPDEVATVIFSKMAIEQVQTIMENTNTLMDRYSLYRNMLSAKSSLTGTELVKFYHLLSMEGQALINGRAVVMRPWAEILADKPIVFSELQQLDLSDAFELGPFTDITHADVIALTKSCPKLTKLILPGAFPSDAVMAVLKANCPQAAIYPSAMTEYEWAHPAEFMAKLPPPPQAIADFINSPRPIWEGKTASEVHMVMPKVNKIIRNDGRIGLVLWTLDNVSKFDKATGGVGCRNIGNPMFQPDIDKPSEVGFEWVVFTKDVLPGSEEQTYDEQKQLVKHWGYEVPGFLDATTCMLWENRLSGNRIYSGWEKFTRCKEKVRQWQMNVGAFRENGLNVGDLDCLNHIGVGGVRKFKV